MMFRTSAAAVALFGLVACSSPGLAPPAGSGEGATSLTVADQAFVTQAAYGGLGEIALGELAQERAESSSVRELAGQLVTEHTQANEELISIAESKGMTPPTAPDAGRQATAAGLAMLSGDAFDRQYLQQQLIEHETTIALFESQARHAYDPNIRAFAAKWLPSLQRHTEQIRALASQRMPMTQAPS